MNILRYMQTDLVTLQAGEPLLNAAEATASERIRHLPILDGERLVGMVSDRDIKRACPSALLESNRDEYRVVLNETPVRRIMRAHPVTVGPDATMADAARLMIEHKIGAVPVVEDDRLVGMVTETDVLRAFLDTTS